MDRRHSIARRYDGELWTTNSEQAVRVDQHGVDAPLRQISEGAFEVAIATDGDDFELNTGGRCRHLQAGDTGPRQRRARVGEHCEARGPRLELMQEAEPLRPKLLRHGEDTGDVAARLIEAGDETDLDWILTHRKHDR